MSAEKKTRSKKPSSEPKPKAAINDTARRKEIEEELAKYRKHLEGMVEQRTAELQLEIVERKKAETALKEKTAQLNTIIENLPFDIFGINKEGKYFIHNAAARENWGDLIGKRPEDLAPDEDTLKLWKDNVNRAFSGEIIKEDVSFPLPDGDNRYYRNIIMPIEDEAGIWGVLGVNIDTTERKKAEESLRLYDRIISSTDDLMAFVSKDYIYKAVNSAYLKAFGRAYKDIVGHSVIELLGKEVFEKTVKHHIDRCLNGDEVHYQAWFEFPGLGRRFLDVVYYPYYEADKTISGLVVSIHDITERRKAEQALEASEKKYRSLVSSLQEGIWAIDKDERTTFVNEPMAEMLGYTVDEMIGKKVFDFMDERGRELCEYYVKRRKQNIKEQHDFELIKKSGDRIYVTMEASPTYDEDGNYVGGVTGVINITERREAEERLKASLKEKEVLLQEIHHRVKNNMTVISSLLMLQSSKIKDKQYKAMFDESMNRIKTMALVHEKLYGSSDLAHIDFGAYLDDMLDSIFMSYAINKNIVKLRKEFQDIKLTIDTAIPCALIVNELVSNSLKYAFPEGRRGDVRVTLCMNDKDEVELGIGDSGVGMPDDIKKPKGKSVGLSIVRGLVKQIKGNMQLNREKGTEFKITFKRPE